MTRETNKPIGPGSLWQRWDPHVHAPGTIFNDQFKGDWDAYFDTLETADPPIRALGITDYYGLDTYRQLLAKRQAGKRLVECELIFPNIELRFSVGTAKAWINAHLLVCPDDPDHLNHLDRFLQRLTFRTTTGPYCATRTDLIRLGRDLDMTGRRYTTGPSNLRLTSISSATSIATVPGPKRTF